LTKGTLDDGRGKARVNLFRYGLLGFVLSFRHQHEKESGRTSSVGMEILGYSSSSSPILSSQTSGRKLTWEEISEKSSKIISFIDLAGHERYLRTTVFGLTGCAPDYVMLMVGGNAGLIGMSKEHLGIAVSLGVPVMVVITKIDMVSSEGVFGNL
jgi:GTPase